MILRRNGNKTQLAEKILPYFPEHKIYIEPFFGAGGMFFNKPKVKYNFLNDLDNDVFNLFMVVKNNRQELYKRIDEMPIHQSLMRYWKKQQETDPIWKAVRFLFISNFTYLSKGYNIKFTADNSKQILLDRIEPTFKYMADAKFMCVDFREVLKMISFQDKAMLCTRGDSFIYSDAPYFDTDGWYTHTHKKEEDTVDHFDMLCNSDIRFGMSEFDNEFIMDMATDRSLNIIHIGERRNLKNRRNEILITNFNQNKNLFSIQ